MLFIMYDCLSSTQEVTTSTTTGTFNKPTEGPSVASLNAPPSQPAPSRSGIGTRRQGNKVSASFI